MVLDTERIKQNANVDGQENLSNDYITVTSNSVDQFTVFLTKETTDVHQA